MQSWFLIIAESSPSAAWRIGLAILLIALALAALWLAYRAGTFFKQAEKLVADLDEEVMPVIDKAETTIDEVNEELDKVNDITENVAHMTERIDAATRAIEQALSKPAKKAASFTSGVSQTVSSFFGRTPADEADTSGDAPGAEPDVAADDKPSWFADSPASEEPAAQAPPKDESTP